MVAEVNEKPIVHCLDSNSAFSLTDFKVVRFEAICCLKYSKPNFSSTVVNNGKTKVSAKHTSEKELIVDDSFESSVNHEL